MCKCICTARALPERYSTSLSFQNGANRELIRTSGGLAPLLLIVAQGEPPAPPLLGTPRREAAYRAAGALENLAADNGDNAAAIVEAGVVPAMKELLIGYATADLSQKAVRKGRESLSQLLVLHHAAARARAAAAAAALSARETAAAAATAQHKARLLHDVRLRGGGSAAAAAASATAATAATAATTAATVAVSVSAENEPRSLVAGYHPWALAESELGGLSRDVGWAHAIVSYARALSTLRRDGPAGDAGDQPPPRSPLPPPPLRCGCKARRAAIYRVVERPPLAELLACRTDAVAAADGAADADGTASEAGEAWGVFVSPRCEVTGNT
jgi:hypothetical protein